MDTDDERRHFLRYTRTTAWPMLRRFPIGRQLHTDLLAQMTAGEPGAVRALIRSLDDEVRTAAAALLADAGSRAAVASLPFRADDRIVAVGDSITADRLGWFELLAAAAGPAGTAGELINLSVSGDTSADVLERFDLLEAARPTRVLLMIGTNDVRRHGRAGGHRMVTAPETERNLRALTALITGDLRARLTAVTPPAVDQDRIDRFFAGAPLCWRAGDVAEIAGVVRTAVPGALDLHAATHASRHDDLLEADGVHPNRTGQRFILARIIAHLHDGN